MTKFVEIGGEYVNVDSISNFRHLKNGNVLFHYKDGTTATAADVVCNDLFGRYDIMQIIPCKVPLYNVWENDDDTHFAERVYFLALCGDGELKGLSLVDGRFEVAENDSNYKGLYRASELDKFTALTKGD